MINDGTPTLIIGIGGIGGQIAGSIYETLSERTKKTVSAIAVDTNIHDLWQLNNKYNIPCVQLSDDLSNRKIIDNNPEVTAWFPDEPYLTKYPCSSGAGMVRAIARLAFVNAEKQGRLDMIEKEITRIRNSASESGLSDKIKICIIGTIVGGTGSGLAVCLPFYLRHILKKSVGLKRCEIDGYFIGADPIYLLLPSKECRNKARANACACLKELNAFFMCPMISRNSENNLNLEFYDHTDSSARNVPYNQIVLLDDSLGDVYFYDLVDFYAQKLFFYLIMNSQSADIAVPDHFLMATRNSFTGGMNRFCSAGMCQLVYPIETAREYVTLAVVKRLIRDEWLLIDSEFQMLVKKTKRLMVEDPFIKMPELKKTYVELFREKTLGDNAQLGKLVYETYIERDNEYIPTSVNFITALYLAVESLLNSEELRDKEEACKVNLQKMKSFSDAESQICDVLEGMDSYSEYAKYLIDTKPNGIADDLVPIFADHKDICGRILSVSCINRLITDVHPVTARFLIYDIINRLEEKVEDLKAEFTDVNLSAYREEDFDNKTKGVQNPFEYLAALQDKPHHFLKILGPIGKAFNTEEKTLAKLGERLSEVGEAHILTVKGFMMNRIKYHVSKIVLERLYKLDEVYRLFFSVVSEIADENNNYIDNLENLHFPYNQYGIYCSADAFRKMVSDFLAYRSQEISSETKKTISHQLFTTYFHSYAISNMSKTKKDTEREYQKTKKTLRFLFQSTVMDEVRNSVIEHGEGIVNLSAREALMKEVELEGHLLPEDEGYYKAVEKSIKTSVNYATIRAKPMLRTKLWDLKIERLLFILSPKCAELDAELEPDDAATARFYLPTSSGATVLINNEAPDTELTLIRIGYHYTIEDILNYQSESENENAYILETQNIGNEKNDMYAPIVITPHLDKYWHEEGFIPALHAKQRQEDHSNCVKALIYGIGYGLFQKCTDKNSGHETWRLNINGKAKSLVRKCDRLIDGSYYALLDSMSFNRRMVKEVLAHARSSVGRFSDCPEISAVLDSPLISGLGGSNSTSVNIFDVFLAILALMPKDEWDEMFCTLLDLLWEYLNRIDCPLNSIDEYAHKIIKTLYASCSVGKKENDVLVVSDKMLIQQYEKMLKQEYKA